MIRFEMRKRVAVRGLLLCAAATTLALGCSSATGFDSTDVQSTDEPLTSYDWPQFFGNSQHSGNNTSETTLNAQNVSGLTQLFRVTLPAVADSAPVILTNISAGGSTRDLAFVTTQAGHVFALDAHTGGAIWSALNTGSNFTTSSPALDPNRAFVYAYGLDGKIHKYAVATGVETTTGGWPAIATLKPQFEKGITSLSLVSTATNNFLSVGFSGYGDFNDYQGHVTTVNLATGGQTVFNANCSNQAVHFVTGGTPDCGSTMSAIWGRSGVVYSAATGRIYAGTGNGTFNPAGHLWGDTVLALNPDGTGANGDPLDTYTPSVFQTLQDQDLDLGSASPAILPNSGTKFPHLAVQAGKDHLLRLLNLDNLSGQGGPGHVGGEVAPALSLALTGDVTAGMPVWTNPADNSTWVFVISTGSTGGIAAYKLLLDGSGNPSLGLMWQQAVPSGTALIANNVLYRATNNKIAALNPATGAALWSNTSIGTVHWHSPVVANGVLYITDNSSQVTAFSVPSGGLSPLPRTGWVASASATNPGDVPGNALDGNVATRFSTGVPQSSASTQSFTVDMQIMRTFSQVTIDSEGGDFARNFQLFASNDPANFGSALVTGNSSGALTTISFPLTTARYIQVRQTTAAGVGAWWSIAELNVLGPTGISPGAPLPRSGWAFSASATAAGDAVANVADGVSTTRWSSGSPQSAATTQTFTVDMLSAQAFDKLTLDSSSDFARNFQVFATNNTANWGTAIATGTGTGPSTVITFAQQNARFIQIRQSTAAGVGSWWSIYELNVYSPSGAPPVALSRTGWTATGSSTVESPANALDGNTATRWATEAAQTNGQSFQVDMQAAKTFRQLTLDAAANTGDFPRGYQVFVSNDGVNFGTAIASGAPTTQLVTVTFATQTARFIKVVQTGTAANWWSIAEFNVYN